jgi:hypothetical protein
LSKFMRQVRETTLGKDLVLWRRVIWRSPNVFRMFRKFVNKPESNGQIRLLYSNFWPVSGYTILAKFWNQEVAEVWNQEVTEVRNQEVAEARNQEVAKLWNHKPAMFGSHNTWRSSWMKDSEIRKKPSQRRYLKSLGLMCELVVGM